MIVYFTDRGIEELQDRRGEEEVTLGWLAERLRDFVDEHPQFEGAIDGLATWLARLDDDAAEATVVEGSAASLGQAPAALP